MSSITVQRMRCKHALRFRFTSRCYSSPSIIAPKPTLDIRHILNNPDLYAQACLSRNCPSLASNPSRIVKLNQESQENAASLRECTGLLEKQLSRLKIGGTNLEVRRQQVRETQMKLAQLEKKKAHITSQIERLALSLPNLPSKNTPKGAEFDVLRHVRADGKFIVVKDSKGKQISHVDIGKHLGILDFTETASGYGSYYLVGAGALLEQALISYALTFTTREGWTPVSSPSLVYSHIAAAYEGRPCHGSSQQQQQVYDLAHDEREMAKRVPKKSLARTSTISVAGMKANAVIPEAQLPLRTVAVSRCYRAEAETGAMKGAGRQGLYEVHEFTMVEMLAWTKPEREEMDYLIDEISDIQTDILGNLGLTCRELDMPVHALGHNASRRISIEAFFPSRAIGRTDDEIQEAAWGEVASTTIYTDHQSRRLATRVMSEEVGESRFPWTISGTALAVPRVLAAILEMGWDGEQGIVRLPEVLHQFMGTDKIEQPKRI